MENYLEAVAAVNRAGRDARLQSRWWVPGLPGVLWERNGNIRNQSNDVHGLQRDFGDLRRQAEAIQPVPPAAETAQAAYLESLDATLAMLDVHERVIAEALQADQDGQPLPAREPLEPTLRASRQEADRASHKAERLMSDLIERYEASQ